MRFLEPVAVAGLLATSTGHAHMAFTAPVGADLSALEGLLPPEALTEASRTGWAILDLAGSVPVLVYSNVERHMSLAPGCAVTLVQADGSVFARTQPAESVVQHDFTAPEPAALPKAA